MSHSCEGNGATDQLKLKRVTADKRPEAVVGLCRETHLGTLKQSPCFCLCATVLKLTKWKRTHDCALLFRFYLSQSFIY